MNRYMVQFCHLIEAESPQEAADFAAAAMHTMPNIGFGATVRPDWAMVWPASVVWTLLHPNHVYSGVNRRADNPPMPAEVIQRYRSSH